MIVEEGKYYLYRHLNPNTNLPFYVGVGTKQNKNHRSFKATYYRAHTFHKENSIWKNIVNKNGFVVEIIIESDDYQFILNKEVEFITLYGRKDIKTGILANLTNGGEGTQPPDKILFTLRQKGIIVYYTDLSTIEIEAEKGSIYVEVYPSSTKVFGIITKEIFPSRHLVLGATYYQDTEVTKEQIIKFIPDGK